VTALTGVRPRFGPYRWALLALLALAFARPLVENLRYPLLTGWDSWSFLALATLVSESDGLVPAWDNLQFQPEGRPFLYPPLVPLLVSAISGLSGLSLFAVVKGFTVVLYPALIAMVVLVARSVGDRRVTLASVAFLLAVNQTFLLSLSALAQAVEILLYLFVIYSLHRRRYVPAAVAYGLTFWTHTFTPLCFGLGLLLWAMLRAEERRRVLAVLGGGVLIGAPWLLRFATHADWIQPNTEMDQHTTLSGWAWAVAVEGFAFVVMAGVLVGILLADRDLARRLRRDRLPSLLACTTLGLALTSYYPERSLTYMAPAVSILLAIAVFRASPAAVRRGLWLGLAALAFVAFDAFDVLGGFTPPAHLMPTLAATGLALLMLHAVRARRSLALVVLLVLLFTDPDGHAPPLAAWADPAQVTRSRLPTEAWDACAWMASRHPGALVATSDFRTTAACNYKGLRTTTGTFMEFSRDGNISDFSGADYYVLSPPGDRRVRDSPLWRRDTAAVYPASAELLAYSQALASTGYDPPKFEVRLQAVGLGIGVLRDRENLDPEYPSPHAGLSGQWIKDTQNWPVVVRTGTRMQGRATFQVDVIRGACPCNIFLEGRTEIGNRGFTLRGAVPTYGSPSDTSFPVTFPIEATLASPRLPEHITLARGTLINWTAAVEPDRGRWEGPAGTSQHDIYVTRCCAPSTPESPGSPRPEGLYFTVLHNTTIAARGETDDAAIVDKIWSDFTDRTVHRWSFHPATGAVFRSTQLEYWDNKHWARDSLPGAVCRTSQRSAVEHILTFPHNAKCGDWAFLLQNALATQGVAADVYGVDCAFESEEPPVNRHACNLLVKKWDFDAPTQGNWPYHRDFPPYARETYSETKDTLPAQGNSNPPGAFDGHIVVTYPSGDPDAAERLLDPSFGVERGGLAAWEALTLDGFEWDRLKNMDLARKNAPGRETLWFCNACTGAMSPFLRAAAETCKRLGIGGLLSQGGFTIGDFQTPAAGTLTVTATKLGARATTASAAGATIARAKRVLRRSGSHRVKVKLTARGRRLLRPARRARIALRVRFTAASGDSATRTRRFTLTR
jgi:hypothetical protein